MSKLNVYKTIATFIITLSILLLVFSVVDLFNKVDYISEYKLCTSLSSMDTMLTSCRTNASTGLGFKIRENQLDLSISQYLMVYLVSLMKILFSITVLIMGISFYTKAQLKPTTTVSKPVVKKKTKR